MKYQNSARSKGQSNIFKTILVSTCSMILSTVVNAATVQLPDPAALANNIIPVKKTSINGVYIVRLKGNPIIAYDGSTKGLKATKPTQNKKLNPTNKHVIAYGDYLTGKHDALIQGVGASKKTLQLQILLQRFCS